MPALLRRLAMAPVSKVDRTKERTYWLRVKRLLPGDEKAALLAARDEARAIVSDLNRRDADEAQKPNSRWSTEQDSSWGEYPPPLTCIQATCCFPCVYARRVESTYKSLFAVFSH